MNRNTRFPRLHRRGNRGFTTVEIAVSVAILVILFALLIPNLISLQKSLRQKELDSKAETIYVAAQNKLVDMRASGHAERYQNTSSTTALVEALPAQPDDRDVDSDEDPSTLYALCSADKGTSGSIAYYLIQDMTADDDLLAHNWIVEYDPEGGFVYAVYYSEDVDFSLSDYLNNWSTYDGLRTFSRRLDGYDSIEGTTVGYYGGDSVNSGSETKTLEPLVDIVNTEKLEARLSCKRTSNSSADLIFTVTLADEEGHSYSTVYKHNSVTNNLEKSGNNYYVNITLDDLTSESTRFNALYGSNSSHSTSEQLVPGETLTVTLKVESSDVLVQSKTTSSKTNSLFSDESEKEEKDSSGITQTAVITYGRHLQNLDALYASDTSTSYNEHITSAKLAKSIDFGKTTAADEDDYEYWYYTYCGSESDDGYFNGRDSSNMPKFKPITAPTLKLFEGNNSSGYTISNMNVVQESSDAGLFMSIAGGVTLQNISLVRSFVSGTQSTGALVGTASGENTITNCRSYLVDKSGDLQTKSETYQWLTGAYTGGLVGTVASGAKLTMDSCLAATVQKGTTSAGGLVGQAEGALALTTSYADSYIYGDASVAGLVGNVGSSGSLTMKNAYAAGFLIGGTNSTVSGISSGAIASSENVYSICSTTGDGAAITYGIAPSASSASATYYLHGGSSEPTIAGVSSLSSMSAEDLLTALGGTDGSFTLNTTSTSHPYNLMGQALSTYTYPRLTANDHYGDWEAEFKAGSLVYYEKYSNDGSESYGFYGADVDSTLSSSGTLLGDGYGIVYSSTDTLPTSVTVTISGTDYTFAPSTDSSYSVTGTDGTTYAIYPLPTTMLNGVLTEEASFYTRVNITEEGTGGSSESVYYFNPYYAKTAKYVQDTTADAPTLGTTDSVYVRSARHLYSTSLYYDYYASATAGRTFAQERDIDYASYDWSGFYSDGVSSVSSQEPIGTDATHFIANYNGNCYWISDVSFISESNDYVGLFGYNEGALSNIVLRCDYTTSGTNYYVKREENIGTNDYVYMGVLAGYNGSTGSINNCAAAGYYLAGSDGTIHAYTNSHLFAGGLVGANEGVIQTSASDCPTMSISTLNAEAYAGGFVGQNAATGIILKCYDLGHVEVLYSRGGSVSIAGFAGNNQGTIRYSYCATSLVASGETAQTYAFTPDGGLVTASYYLSDGTYTYIGQLRSYNCDKSLTEGTSATRDALCNMRGSAWADADHVFDYSETSTSTDDGYPYAAVVQDRDGEYVHYGNWQREANLGSLGVFYWEHEEEGSNTGYHLTFIGLDEGSSVGGTTLCTAHDDGGVITEYGYGYYAKSDEATGVSSELSNIANSGETVNAGAQTALNLQMQEYTFYPYTTQLASEVIDGTDYLYLSSTDASVREGTWTLTYGDNTYSFNVAPFFANAMSYSGAGTITSTDGVTTTDFSVTSGEEDNPYEIRSLQQLQYLNWNSTSQNTSSLVTASNYQQFPYLQYATVTSQGTQTESAALANRSRQYWIQTHDMSVADGESMSFTPIAGAATSSARNSYNSILYAWFGGSYDGKSYKMQNFDISSDCFTVGVFGVTVGAQMENIIMYSSDGNTITRETPDATKSAGIGAYALGGLIGVAYDYGLSSSTTSSNVITNCAIAGYTIVDESTNILGQGEANVGGLTGVANVSLEGCSSVVDINVACTHSYGSANYGNYVRVGGLTGAAQGKVTSCYTGGTITVDDTSANEWFGGNDGRAVSSGTTHVNRFYNTHIYVSGVAGSAFASNYINFTNSTSAYDGKPTLTDCYSYVKLPDMRGTIKGVSYIASPADRYSNPTRVTMSNCHYLETVNSAISYTEPEYYFLNKSRKAITEAEFEAIKLGDLNVNKQIINQDQNQQCTIGKPASVSYANLSSDDYTSTIGASYGKVTVTEGSGASIHGKYSFPGSRSDLKGKDYPFPTIVTQEDLVYGGTVNVHYGEWPLNGVHWADGMATMDIFDDMVSEGTSAGWAEKTFTLNDPYEELVNGGIELSTNSFSLSEEGIVEITGVEKQDDQTYLVTVRALAEGAVTITEKASSSGADFILTVTADLDLTASPTELKGYLNKTTTLALTASSGEKDYTSAGTWTFDDCDKVELSVKSTGKWTVKFIDSGVSGLGVSYSYTYNGTDYTQRLNIPVKVFGAIGLSVDDALTESGDALYLEAQRQLSSSAVTAEEKVYSKDAPTLPVGVDGDFFLYESKSDLEIDDTGIDGVSVTSVVLSYTVGGTETTRTYDLSNKTTAEDEYFSVTLDTDNKCTDDYFQYLPCFIRYKETEAIGIVTATVNLTHTKDVVDSDAETTTPYVYTANMYVPVGTMYYYANGGTGTMAATKVLSDQSYTLPECTFERTGYSFAGWQLDGDTSGKVYAVGESYTPSGDATFNAVWTAITYKVIFNKNNDAAVGSMDAQTLTYGETEKLTKNAYMLSGYVFRGWSTESDGDIVYLDEEEVTNLATEQDAEVNLYAQWGNYKVTLDVQSSVAPDAAVSPTSFVPEYGKTSAIPDYEITSPWGYALEGWYTEANGGTLVVKADGSVVSDTVEGYAENGKFIISSDVTLYAHWRNAQINLIANGTTYTYEVDVENLKLLEYTKPERTEDYTTGSKTYTLRYMLDGYYTDSTDLGGTKLINADGTIIEDTKKQLEDGMTLHARWAQSPKEDYTPNGAVWNYKSETNGFYGDPIKVNFDNGEYISVTMDITSCADYNVSNQELIALGGAIVGWSNSNTLHFYYTPTSNDMGIKINGSPSYNTRNGITGSTMQVIFAKETFTIYMDGEEVSLTNSDTAQSSYKAMIASQMAWNANHADTALLFDIGSCEGSGRSYASNYVVRVDCDTNDYGTYLFD